MERTEIKNPAPIIAIAAFAAFLATFNETYLNVGFAPIMSALSVDVSTVQWLATAYMLGAAVMVPISAFAYRSIPTKPLFLACTALLIIGSIIGALAPTFAVLLVGRIVQALGTGMLIPTGMSITLEVAPREKLGTFMGIMGAMTTLGPSLSVIVAGVILSFAPWNMLLWVFAILTAICFLAALVLLPNVATLTKPKLDVLSIIFIGLALIGILYGVSTIFTGSIPVACVTIVVGAVLLALFVKRQNTIENPLINLKPLTIAPYTIGVLCNMLALIAIFAMNIIVPTFLQSVLGIESIFASLALFPAIALSCVLSPIAGRLYDKNGAGTILPLGFACIAVFAVLVALIIGTGNIVLLAVLYIPIICGSALIIGPVQSFALSKLTYELNPHGVTVMSTGFQIAGCVGSSVFTGVYAMVIAGQTAEGAAIFDASNAGFFAAGVLVAIFSVIGFILALRVRAYETADKRAAAKQVATNAAVANMNKIPAEIIRTDVFSVDKNAKVIDAMRLFSDKHVSGAPVTDGSKLFGFISDGDIMNYLGDQNPLFTSPYSFVLEQGNADFGHKINELVNLPVSDVCVKNVISVDINDDLGDICRVMADHHLKKVPVMKNGRIAGVINRSDITQYSMARYLEAAAQ